MKITNVSLGADPELFIINSKTGKVVSAIGIIPGEKDEPFTDGLDRGFGVEIDGILAEFNIPPAHDKGEFVDSIKYMKDWIRNWVKQFDSDYDICCKATMEVPKDQLKNKKAHILGCEPSYNAYTGRKEATPEKYPDAQRVAAFHCHLGYKDHNVEDSVKFVKYFDLACGVPSVFEDRDTFRRTLYGQSGNFRIQPWGVEARVLSSYMLNDVYLEKVYDRTMLAIEMFNDNVPLPESDLIQRCINTSNEVLARHILDLYGLKNI